MKLRITYYIKLEKDCCIIVSVFNNALSFDDGFAYNNYLYLFLKVTFSLLILYVHAIMSMHNVCVFVFVCYTYELQQQKVFECNEWG